MRALGSESVSWTIPSTSVEPSAVTMCRSTCICWRCHRVPGAGCRGAADASVSQVPPRLKWRPTKGAPRGRGWALAWCLLGLGSALAFDAESAAADVSPTGAFETTVPISGCGLAETAAGTESEHSEVAVQHRPEDFNQILCASAQPAKGQRRYR